MKRRVKCLPVAVECITRPQNTINDYKTLTKGQTTLGEQSDAHRTLNRILHELIEERNRAINDAIPSEVFNVDSIYNLSITVELDPEVEELIGEALRLSSEYINRITGISR